MGNVMTDFQVVVGAWANRTFPESTLSSICKHLGREVDELALFTRAPEEGADCLLILLHHAHRAGYDLFAEARKKFEINKERQWGEPDAQGVVEHVRETSEPE